RALGGPSSRGVLLGRPGARGMPLLCHRDARVRRSTAMAKDTAPQAMKSWQEMFDHQRARLLEQTGESIDVWNQRIRADASVATEADLRTWLEQRGIGGYLRMLLVYERFGYPGFLTLTPDALVEGQFEDRPGLRPILEKLLKDARKLVPVDVLARKSYLTHAGRR